MRILIKIHQRKKKTSRKNISKNLKHIKPQIKFNKNLKVLVRKNKYRGKQKIQILAKKENKKKNRLTNFLKCRIARNILMNYYFIKLKVKMTFKKNLKK